jgi:hypothetical protein
MMTASPPRSVDRPRLRRHRPEGVVALEIWDLLVEGVPLHETRDLAEFPRRLAQGVMALCRGRARCQSGLIPPERCRTVDTLFVGGGALAAELERALRTVGLPLHVSGQPAFVAEVGGRKLLNSLGARSGLVVDIGQTAIKISHNQGRARYPRDFSLLPLAVAAGPAFDGRPALRRFLASALADAARAVGDVDAIVLALPAALDDAGRPGGCSYPGLAQDAHPDGALLVPEALMMAGLDHVPCLLLNDAELAALSAREATPPQATTLVLTLGFGVGGALLLPAA